MSKLIILDINGTLCNREKSPNCTNYIIPIKISKEKYLYKRPYLDKFLTYCFTNYKVAIWTSMMPINAMKIIIHLFTEEQISQLLFIKCADHPLQKNEVNYKLKKEISDYEFDKVLFIDDTLNKMVNNDHSDYYIIPTYLSKYSEQDNALLILMKCLPSLL